MATKYVSSAADGTRDGSQATNGGAGVGPWTFAQMLAATPAAGDEIRIMADGTYSRSATATIGFANGTAAANIKITGANSSGTVDGTRPTIQASAGTFTLLSVTGNHIVLDYLIADGNSQTSVTGIDLTTSYMRARRSKAINCTVSGFKTSGDNGQAVLQCEASGCSGTAGFNLLGASIARFCYSHDNTIHGFVLGANATAEFCISETNTGASTDGFSGTSVGYRGLNCVAWGNGRAGFDLTGNAGFGTYLTNCIGYGNTGEDFRTDGVKSGAFLINCAGRAAGTGYSSTNLKNVDSYATLTGDPFTAAASGDFSLNNTAGAGAACRAAGFPGLFTGGLATGYQDIGAIQHADPAGGSGGGCNLLGNGTLAVG